MIMKDIIKKVLDRHKDGQGNMGSDSFREMLAVEIEAVLLSEDTQGLPYHTNHLADEDSPLYPWHEKKRDKDWAVEQYNRNRPIEEHISKEEPWIYESPNGKIVYRRRMNSDKRQIKYTHPDYGPPYGFHSSMSGKEEWLDEDYAKQRHWYKDFISNGGNNE